MFGERLRKLRKEKRLTMEELAEKLELSRSGYSAYENESRKPPLDLIIQLAEFHNTSADYILGLTDNPTSDKDKRDFQQYIQNNDLTWGGVPLKEDELKPIKDLLEVIVRDRLPNHKDK